MQHAYSLPFEVQGTDAVGESEVHRRQQQEIIDLEAKTGKRYAFGGWAPTQTLGDPQWGGGDAKTGWDAAVNDVPAPVRKAMTELVRGNLLSDAPTPIIFDVEIGTDHGIRVGYGQDTSVTPSIPAMLITMICKS